MKILTCPKCQSQFDVSTMQAGSNFVCGKCRNVLEVPAAAPVIQPAPVVAPMPQQARPSAQVVRPAAQPPAASAGPPPTVVLSPDEMRRALAAARGMPEPAAGKSAPKLPPAMEARRHQQATQPTSRAGGPSAPAPAPIPAAAPAPVRRAAAPAPAPAPIARSAPAAKAAPAPAAKPLPVSAAASPGRASRRSRDEGDDEAPEKKSQTGLYAAVGAGVLVLGVVGFMMTRKGGGESTPPVVAGPAGVVPTTGAAPGTPGAGPAAGQPVVAPAPANLDEWGKFLRMPELEQRAFAATKRADATGNAEKLKALHDWFTDPRLLANKVAQDTVKAVVDDAVRADGSLEWANVAKGRKNVWEMLRTTRQDCAKAFGYKEKDEDEIDAALEKFEKDRWVDAKEFAKYDAVAARVRERDKSLTNDPRLLLVEERKGFIRTNPLFKDFKFLYRFADPYLICQQYEVFTDADELHKNKARLEKANLFANRDAIIFSELNRQYRSLFAERFKLPELKEKKRILVAVITWNNQSYRELYRASNNGEEPAAFIRAFYSPPEQKIFHYIGDDSMRAQDEMPVANGRVQKGSDQVTFHEGLHQLMHEYGAVFQGKPLVDGNKITPPRKAMWFDEGLAEFMGSVEVDKSKKDDLIGATFYHNRLLGERIDQVIGDGKGSNFREVAKKWTIAEMIQPNHNGELIAASGKLYPNSPVYMANLFYARAWGFVHFCWFYDNGKYRKPFLDYMEKVLSESHGPDALAKAFGRKDSKDWKGIDAEFEWYWDKCLGRRFGWKDEGKTKPWNTETDPPQGKFDPNEKPEDE